jgi:hypothetical protein
MSLRTSTNSFTRGNTLRTESSAGVMPTGFTFFPLGGLGFPLLKLCRIVMTPALRSTSRPSKRADLRDAEIRVHHQQEDCERLRALRTAVSTMSRISSSL